MKRGWKIFWIVCAACMGVGIVCCAASFTLGVTVEAIKNRFPNGIGFVSRSYGHTDYDSSEDFDIDDAVNDFDEDYEDNDISDDYDYDEDIDHYNEHHEDNHHGTAATDYAYDVGNPNAIVEGSKKLGFNNVSELDVDVWAGEIHTETDASLSDVIVIETNNVSKKLGLRCYMDGNELKVTSKKKVLGINDGTAGRIIIHIPAEYHFEEASLGLSAGYLHITEISADDFGVDVGAGEGKVDSFVANEADLNCGAGSLTAAGSVKAEVDIACGVGEITYMAQGKESDYNYNIDCGMGQIICGKNTYSGLGRTKNVDHHSVKEMDIECGVGTITVDFSE